MTFFIGENGTGKSTLLEGIAVAEGFNADAGSRNFLVGPQRQLFPAGREFLQHRHGGREVGLRAGNQPLWADLFAHEQSHGESFLALLLNRLGGIGLYLMDEPEAALSPQRHLNPANEKSCGFVELQWAARFVWPLAVRHI